MAVARAALGVDPGDAGRRQPAAPVRRLAGADVVVQQRVAAQVLRRAQRRRPVHEPPVHELGTAHREHRVLHERVDLEPGVVPQAVADAHVRVVAAEVDQPVRGRDLDIDLRVALAEARQARQEPLGGQGVGDAHGQRPGVLVGAQAPGRRVDSVEGRGQGRQVELAGVGQHEPPVQAPEQLHAERLLQGLDLMADRGLGDVELLGRLGERQVPGRGLEGAQGVERGQASGHAISGLEILIRNMKYHRLRNPARPPI